MTTIQAYKRTKPYAHVFPDLQLLLEFKPNALGDVVCKVESAEAVERLLQVPTGFRVYGQAEHAVEAPPLLKPQPPAEDSKYVLKNGDTVLDLRTLNEEQLRGFCKANGIRAHHAAKPDTIRDVIVEALKVEG